MMNNKRRESFHTRQVAVLVFAVVSLVLPAVMCGCGGKTNGDSTPLAEQREVEFASGATATVVREGGQPVSLAMEDGQTISLAGSETVVDDQLVIRTQNGGVEVHRKPNTIMDEMDGLPHLYLKEGSLDEFVSDGFRGEPYIGAERVLYWSARICQNPDCESQTKGSTSRPYLMINRLPGVWLDDDGKLASANKVPTSLVSPCPVCGSAEHLSPYILPETARRKAELAGELARVRAARGAAIRTN